MATYEQLQEEDYDVYRPNDEVKAKPRKREKRKAFTPTRCPWCFTPIRVFDEETVDDKIDQHIVRSCEWVKANAPDVLSSAAERMALAPAPVRKKGRK